MIGSHSLGRDGEESVRSRIEVIELEGSSMASGSRDASGTSSHMKPKLPEDRVFWTHGDGQPLGNAVQGLYTAHLLSRPLCSNASSL